jgi:hypothetical protein
MFFGDFFNTKTDTKRKKYHKAHKKISYSDQEANAHDATKHYQKM